MIKAELNYTTANGLTTHHLFISLCGTTFLEILSPVAHWTEDKLIKHLAGENGTKPMTITRTFLEQHNAIFTKL